MMLKTVAMKFVLIIIGLFSCTNAWVSGEVKNTIHLKAIPAVAAPEIDKKTVKITINFVFDHTPSEYWLHYDKKSQRLIFEFFGVHFGDSLPQIKGTSVISDLMIVNNESDLAFNSKISRLSMKLEDGWHYDSWLLGGSVLRLQLWMPLDPGKKLNNPRRVNVLPFILTIIGTATAIVLLLTVSFGRE